MRVIQKGSEAVYRMVCGTCRSVLEYTSDDVKSAYTGSTTGRSSCHPKYVVCPMCDNIIEVD